MAEGKKSFLLYCDLIHTVEKLSDDEAGRLMKHILRYVNDLNPNTDDRIVELSFEPIKQGLKRDLQKYESIVERNRANGKKGGRPSKEETQANPNEPKKPTGFNDNPKNPSEPKKADSDSDSDSVTDNVKDKENKEIPLFEDFKKYALSKEPQVDLKALNLKYDAWIENGWKDGHDNVIKNWKVKLINTIVHLPKKPKTKWISPI